LAAGLRDVTAGHGADVVLDAVGGPLFMPCMRALALNGRYVVMGAASQAPSPFDARALLPRGQTIAGVLVARVAELDSSEPQRAWDEVQARYAAGVLRPELTVLGPGDFASAHERIEARTLTGRSSSTSPLQERTKRSTGRGGVSRGHEPARGHV
jgi:NADPH:quinone reductase